MSYINYNGRILPAQHSVVSSEASSLTLGLWLIETILVTDGRIQLSNYHWERLSQGMKQLGYGQPTRLTPVYLDAQVLETVAANSLEDLCRVRLQVFEEQAGSTESSFLIECFAISPRLPAFNEEGLHVGIAEGLVKTNDAMANLKLADGLYKEAAALATTAGMDDVLLLNQAGRIIESSIANIFWVKDATIFTPSLSEGCIAGVMRRHLLQQLPLHGYNVIQAPLPKELLLGADEVFVTNAIRRIKWIRKINQSVFTNGLSCEIERVVALHNQ